MAHHGQAQRQRPKSKAETSARKPPAFVTERIPNKLYDAGVAFAAYRAGLARSVPSERLSKRLLTRTDQAVRMSNAEHLTAIASAYAAFILLQREPDFAARIVDLARKLGVRITKRTDPLTVILRAIVEYPEGSSGAEARKRYERDAKAIRFLLSERVYPDRIRAEAQRNGEGLDAWSRRYRADQRAKSEYKNAVKPMSSADATPSAAVPRPKPPISACHRAVSVVSSKGSLTLTAIKPADSRALDLFLELLQQRQSQKRRRGWRMVDAVVFSLLKEAVGHQDIPYFNLAKEKQRHRLRWAEHLQGA